MEAREIMLAKEKIQTAIGRLERLGLFDGKDALCIEMASREIKMLVVDCINLSAANTRMFADDIQYDN